MIATFALDGPEKCSGLKIQRYDGRTLAVELGPRFELPKTLPERHQTPRGGWQSFQYSLFKRGEENSLTPDPAASCTWASYVRS